MRCWNTVFLVPSVVRSFHYTVHPVGSLQSPSLLAKLRHERQRLEEEVEILRLQREKAHLDGEEEAPSDDEYNEVVAAFKKELGSLKSEKEIRKLAEKEIAEILQGRGEVELTEEDQSQISRIKQFVETYLETLK